LRNAVHVRHCGQPGDNAHTCPILLTDREQQQQQQHILTPASAKPVPAQRHVHHFSVCEAARHTHALTHMRACAHKHTRTHMGKHSYTHVHTYTHIHTHAHAHIRTQTHANSQAGTHSYTRTHMHMYARVAHVTGFANFSALLAMLPHFSLLASYSYLEARGTPAVACSKVSSFA